VRGTRPSILHQFRRTSKEILLQSGEFGKSSLDFSGTGKYDDRMPADPEDLRTAMRQWATGVTVVSSCFNDLKHGMTVSSFTSVSLEPPLLLVSLEQVTKTQQLVRQAGFFGVTIMGQHQREISDRFAGRIPDSNDRFTDLPTFTMVSGAPFLSDGLAWFDCKVVATYTAGNHTVYIGEVLEVRINNLAPPLIYYDRDYRKLNLNDQAPDA
jgi:flavin reductase (DIM6/NTAB) family NADH-FMN oxidoreductase RutF